MKSNRLLTPARVNLPGSVTAWLEAGLGVSVLLLMPILALVPHGIAPLAVFAGLCAAGLVVANWPPRSPALLGPAMLFGALLVWGGLSAIWGINPRRSLVLDLQLAGLVLTGFALLAAAFRVAAPWRLAPCLFAGAAAGLVIAGYDLASAGGFTNLVSVRGFRPARLDQIAMGLAILPLPAGALLFARGQPVAGVAIVLIAAAAVFLLDDVSAQAALLASLPMAVLLYWRPRQIARLTAAAVTVFVLTAPLTLPQLERIPGLFTAADAFKSSAGHRLLIWSFVGRHIAERPVLGWGLDASRAIPGGNQEARPGQNWLSLHPHNAPLQVWLELGAPGAALYAALIALFWLRINRLPGPPIYRAAAGGALTAALAPVFAAYGVWQEWWISTLALVLFLVVAMGRAAVPEGPTRPPRPGWRAGGR